MTADSRSGRIDLADARRRDALVAIADRFGTPCYVYDFDEALARVAALKQAFGEDIEISYAVKANPNRALLRALRGAVEHLDISSGGEQVVALDAGFAPAALTFVGPAKQRWEIAAAIEAGCGRIIVESLAELALVAEEAGARGRRQSVLLRVNPMEMPKGFGLSMSRQATIFGVDEEELDDAVRAATGMAHVALEGFHIYAGTQCLDNAALIENIANAARIFSGASARHNLRPSLLVIGSGFGIPYHDGSKPIDIEAIAAATSETLRALRRDCLAPDGRLALEIGRYIVGEAGVFLSRVLASKDSRGQRLLALDGGMNHFSAASGNFGVVIKRNFPIDNISSRSNSGETETYTVAGPLCTTIDTMGRAAALPMSGVGDVIAIGCAGAYGPTASPVHFISHRPPLEIAISEHGASVADVTGDGVIADPPHRRQPPR